MKNAKETIRKIKELVNSNGYIYALCMILFEDFHVNPEQLHTIDYRERLNVKEASLLLGFLIQRKINFAMPATQQDLIRLKKNTYELVKELHDSFMIPFVEKLQKSFEKQCKVEDSNKDRKAFFGSGELLVESIFYSGTGVYDFQYLDFLGKKYKYDKEWLLSKREFDIEKIKSIVTEIKNILQQKANKVHLYVRREELPQITKDIEKKYPGEDWGKHINEMLPAIELYQYVDLFSDHVTDEQSLGAKEIKEEGWKSFYYNLIELFVIRKSDFSEDSGIDSFLKNFSICYEENLNSQFQEIGNHNWFNAKPIIQLDEARYFVPISFSLFEAVYESPFYWMWEDDKSYRDQLGQNRGKTGEEITHELLSQVFGKNRTFKSVKVSTKKGHDDTDIDVLCVLGSKALCVQVKAKKLTELARTGNDEQLQKDFKGAVQDAYSQGLISRKRILERNAKFFAEDGNEIKLSEEIDEVYIMGITTENYPSLTHQSHVMLEKKDGDPFPIFSTIFDLELLTHYLNDPYDLLYYIRQRTSLMDYFKANEEMTFLGYHLCQKLWKTPNIDSFLIDESYSQLIDRNYFPFRADLDVSGEEDAIKNRWKSEDFDRLCNRLKTLNEPKITDIIFHLLDQSGDSRKNLTDYIIQVKQQTLRDGKFHNFSMPPNNNSFEARVGFTYVSINSDNSEDLEKRLLTLCQARKYKSKGEVWIGFGSLKGSREIIDAVFFNDKKWEFDQGLEELSNFMFEGENQGRQIRIGKKIGRNKKCPCGSRLKYKKCCGN